MIALIVTYGHTLDASFHFDDEQDIAENPSIRSPWNPHIWKTTRPVAYFSFALNYAADGLDVTGYHLVNIAIHFLNAILIFWFIIITFHTPCMKHHPLSASGEAIAFLCALLFLVHPLQTQAVTYIVQRMASLATTFYLLTLIFYAKARLHADAGKEALFYSAALIAAILGLLTKQIVYTIPVIIVLYDLIFLRSLANVNLNKTNLAIAAGLLISVCLVGLLTGTFNVSRLLRTIPPQQGQTFSITGYEYLLTQIHVIVTYLRLLLFPIHQNLDYDYPITHTFWGSGTILCSLLLISLFVVGLFLLRNHRLIGFGILWFFITLLVESSFYPLPNVLFEHRMYLPGIGGILAIVSAIETACHRHSGRLKLTIAVIIILMFISMTWQRNKVWASEYSLWTDVVSKSPNKARGWCNLGKANFELNNYDIAIEQFNRSLSINPYYAVARFNRSQAYIATKNYNAALIDLNNDIAFRPDHAKAYYFRSIVYYEVGQYNSSWLDINRALELDSTLASGYFQRGLLSVQKQDFPAAFIDFRKTLQYEPKHAEAMTNLGILCSRQNDFTHALKYFSDAITIHPANADIYDNRGLCYFRMGDFSNAIKDYNFALAIDSTDASILLHRGKSYSRLDSLELALKDFSAAIACSTDFVDAFFQRSLVFAALGYYKQAINDLSFVIAKQPDNDGAYVNRGLNYANLNQWKSAISDYNHALKLNPAQQTALLNRAIAFYYTHQFSLAQQDIDRYQPGLNDANQALIEQIKNAIRQN
ncbi:tetratricopeptide repeat protein [candidate division KSB1 bacterium]|nr:tetratricopeptide repeat protein [candidate division KSB1 bacterium]